MWKMLHLLNTMRPGKGGLTEQELADAGINCGADTLFPLLNAGTVHHDGAKFTLTPPSSAILSSCLVANRRWSSDDLYVDDASVFVVMPFSEPWSDTVYRRMIAPAAEDAGLMCTRGDTISRTGDLTQNIWSAILRAGVIVVDVSALNANVFYELGLGHALGKDTLILRQKGGGIPADILGSHYHEYDAGDLDAGKASLRTALRQWALDAQVLGVKALREP